MVYIPMLLQQVVSLFGHSGERPEYFLTVFTGLIAMSLYMIGCVLLIIYSDKVSAKLFADEKLEFSTSLEKDQIMAIAFSCMGLMVICSAVPNLLNAILMHISRLQASGNTRHVPVTDYVIRYVSPLIQLALGFWLFLGSQGIVNIRHKIRGR